MRQLHFVCASCTLSIFLWKLHQYSIWNSFLFHLKTNILFYFVILRQMKLILVNGRIFILFRYVFQFRLFISLPILNQILNSRSFPVKRWQDHITHIVPICTHAWAENRFFVFVLNVSNNHIFALNRSDALKFSVCLVLSWIWEMGEWIDRNTRLETTENGFRIERNMNVCSMYCAAVSWCVTSCVFSMQ